MIRKIICIIFSILWVLNSHSQEFGTHWISYPFPDDSTEVMFRHTYITKHRPQQAYITFASMGSCKVYINERNVSREVYYRNTTPQGILLHTYDVTRYLRPDSNTIAVWYAPCPQATAYSQNAASKQLTLDYYGTSHNGSAFYQQADESWSCSLSEGNRITQDSIGNTIEVFDNRQYDNNWKASDFFFQESEKPVHRLLKETKGIYTTLPTYPAYVNRLRHVLSPIAEHEDSLGLHYDFGRFFQGSVRITLREAKKGERLEINGLVYICSGEMDEQAFRRLSTSQQKSITIKGDRHFRKSQIQKIEGLEIY